MAENILETRILLRYATFSQWMNSDVILKPGEAAVVAFPRINTLLNTDDTPAYTPPAIGIKIGDGQHYFEELPWVQGIAADVYAWAKASEKPTYSATEITGLDEYINAHSQGGGGGGSSSASSSYRIVYDENTKKYTLQYYDEDLQDWVSTTSEVNLSEIYNRISTIERWANGAKTKLGNIEIPIAEYVYEEVLSYLNRLDYEDEPVSHQFVTSVVQDNGKIAVTRAAISASDISSGVITTERGGTGLTYVEEDEVLVGSPTGAITTHKFVTTIDENRAAFATVGAIQDYVAQQTAGLTGAMHFIGEATVAINTASTSRVDPGITGYDFRNAQPGDVILANNSQEFVWTGDQWRLLGDEGSYAIKGSIKNTDIAEDANISQFKIEGLEDSFNTKVDKVDGKQLSTNDYSDEDKNKLDNIEDDAQVNIIEHVFLNNDEIIPTTVNGLQKSVDLHFNGMTQEQGEKLENIEAGAQVNIIEHIKLNGSEITPDNTKSVNLTLVEYTTEEKEKLATIEANAQENIIEKIIVDGEEQTPDAEKTVIITTNPHREHENKIESIYINNKEYPPNTSKEVRITLDQAALNLNVLEGARYPTGATTYSDVEVTDKKLELARIAATGDVQHLLQTQDTYIILNCGSSTTVI